jgi:hypothetical protein
MLSRAAIEAVTDPGHVAPVDDLVGERRVEGPDVVTELRRLEGVGAREARQLAREAVVHVGGHVERRAGRGMFSGRLMGRSRETWWVPRSAVRS